MTTFDVAPAVRAAGARRGLLLDVLYLLAVVTAVLLGGAAQLALAVPVVGVLGLRAARRRRSRC